MNILDKVKDWYWYLFEGLYRRYVLLLKKYTKLQNDSTVYFGKIDSSAATQKDKPSPSSSLTLKELESRLSTSFNNMKQFQFARVQNTNSMEPWLDDNCSVVCEKLDYNNTLDKEPLKVGQVCVYDGTKSGMGSKYVIHRITKIDGDTVYFKGDNNFHRDPTVNSADILWRVCNVGYAQQPRAGD